MEDRNETQTSESQEKSRQTHTRLSSMDITPNCGEPTSTAISTQMCHSAADHRAHLHLSLLSITSLTAAVRLNLIMDEKGTSRLSLPECTERMRKTMMKAP